MNSVAIVEAFWAAVWQGKDFDAIDRFVVDDFVITSGGVDTVSKAKFKEWAIQFNSRINDLTFDVIETFQNADGSRVASRWHLSGKNNGIAGLPADQREISLTGTAVWAVREDGKLLHNWVERALWEMLQRLDAGPALK
ncbi:snoaL-like polyketide cyclase family protein [Janthinobacterium agaricidamnosum NBRC 102515 = DSM 9628]|uniref:SnoaL-like polyketide cyclase family protein n=2 Tax=Janthinobacterium agaricidamnosum TaxID=55508 RepID=W0V744_9BURK|nr:snoaL-like polyketide cyclase family protein [Janthinobacterium agaricidamnosum NBRC 102515 = DSM 9628]